MWQYIIIIYYISAQILSSNVWHCTALCSEIVALEQLQWMLHYKSIVQTHKQIFICYIAYSNCGVNIIDKQLVVQCILVGLPTNIVDGGGERRGLLVTALSWDPAVEELICFWEIELPLWRWWLRSFGVILLMLAPSCEFWSWKFWLIRNLWWWWWWRQVYLVETDWGARTRRQNCQLETGLRSLLLTLPLLQLCTK